MTSSTKTKNNQPSSPRDFFQRIYGDLEKKNVDGNVIVKKEDTGCSEMAFEMKKNTSDLIAPIPILATPTIPFLMPSNEPHIAAAAAAGLSAFREYI